MPPSNASAAYTDCYELLDRALASPAGIRVGFEEPGAANNLRLRLNMARTIDRRKSRELYPEGDPRYSASAYDSLMNKIREHEGKYYVYIEPRRVTGAIIVEELHDEEP